MWYGGGFSFQLQNNNIGLFREAYQTDITIELQNSAIDKFWLAMDTLDIWNLKKKYPYWNQKYEPILDGCSWELKLRNKQGKVKYSSGYESYPRKFNKLIEELNKLFFTKLKFYR